MVVGFLVCISLLVVSSVIFVGVFLDEFVVRVFDNIFLFGRLCFVACYRGKYGTKGGLMQEQWLIWWGDG